MAKVIFEFNDEKEEDKSDIKFIANRESIKYAMEKLIDLRSKIYNGKLYNNELVSVEDDKIVKSENYDFNKTYTEYVRADYIDNELGYIIDYIRDYIDY